MAMDRVLIREKLLLYAVTDRSWLKPGETLSDQVEAVLKGGATMIQLREKSLPKEEFLTEAQRLLPLCRKYGTPLIINDDLEVAVRSGADGVHIGQEDAAYEEARRLLGPDKIIGVSAHNPAEALAAQKAGADYLGSGAVFGSSTKQGVQTLTPKGLEAICRSVSLPVVAIGGIGAENLPLLNGTGAAGAAVISALFAAPDKEAAARELAGLAREMVWDKTHLIFDLDGTLIDSMEVWEQLPAQYCRQAGLPFEAELEKLFRTMSMGEAAEYLARTYPQLTSGGPARLVKEMEELLRSGYEQYARLKPGVQSALERFRQAGRRMCVASASQIDAMESVLTRLGVREYFDFLLSCDQVGAGKEKPKIYQACLDRWGLSGPRHVLVFEDALYAAKTAREAGFAVAGVEDHFQTEEERRELIQLSSYYFQTAEDWGKIQ